METRVCRTCGKTKPIGSFPRRSGRSAHLREHTCGYCRKQANLKRHPEKKRIESYRRRARQLGVTLAEYLMLRDRRAYRRSVVKVKKARGARCPLLRAYPKVEYQVNRAYYLAKSKRWSAANPVLAYAKKLRRRLRLAGVKQDLTLEQWEGIKRAFGYRCAYCGQCGKLTMDHVTPISKGGDHTLSNVVPACSRCNSSKHAGPPLSVVQPMLIV
jgi:5-methylcytosine-specific restriction endonuclease McrA